MDREAWWATMPGVTKESDMTELLNTHTHTHLNLSFDIKANSSVCVLITQGQIFMRIHPTGMMDALSIWDTWVPSMLFTRPS